ncbi:hypothetical protein EJB05_22194 [Eragrostis curvula]|uniref:Uncharacterized protein n=1 Tax=Eragrostis curvula TaxID=38414 RepID=A0A5J9V4X1_9POAL|nr:hypothetical protein EJB05_22194 [Eragrostis curvula]
MDSSKFPLTKIVSVYKANDSDFYFFRRRKQMPIDLTKGKDITLGQLEQILECKYDKKMTDIERNAFKHKTMNYQLIPKMLIVEDAYPEKLGAPVIPKMLSVEDLGKSTCFLYNQGMVQELTYPYQSEEMVTREDQKKY